MQDTRSELKVKLDKLAAGSVSIPDLQKMLMAGPERSLALTSDSIEVRMNNPARAYKWEMADPRTAVACLIAVGEYEPLETQILRNISKSCRVVIDIGANVGYYTVELGKELQPAGKLISIEPVLQSFLQLSGNVRLNNLSGTVELCCVGLSDVSGTAEMFIPNVSGSSAASMRNLHSDEKHESQVIKLETLDNLLESMKLEGCDLIKIDVEGAEFPALKGAEQTIKKYKPVIFAELLRKWSSEFSYHPNSVLEFLVDRGYSCWGVSPQLRYITEFTDMDQETNFIFVHTSDKHGVVEYLESLRS